jgi:hypothetical protein
MKIEPIYIVAAVIAGIGIYLYLNRPKEIEPEFIRPLPTNQYVIDPLQLEDIYSRHARPFTYDFNQNEGWNVDNIHRSFRDYLQNKYTLY